MSHDHRSSSPCQRTRLAEGSVASVDLCDCGVLHVNLGAISVRLCPRALADLISTLSHAVAAHTTQKSPEQLSLGALPLSGRAGERGEA